jgi:nucleoside 2-deoxyribosyltransferase
VKAEALSSARPNNQPTLEKFKYSVVRIDKVQDSGRIAEQILNQIARSEIVLADLTGERPNCYYEAGYAHALGKEIILTVKRGGKVHFDLASNRFILWGTEEESRKELTKRLEAIQQRVKQAR